MRNSVLRQSPFARITICALVGLSLAFSIAGCGGGGGSPSLNDGNNNNNNPPPGQSPTLAFINGRVVDNSSAAAGVANATVKVVGTNIIAQTATNGTFTLPNVPLASTQFTVTSPDPNSYYNYAAYLSKQYDTINCTLPLPSSLTTGRNDLPGNIVMSLGGVNPPPPPNPAGCP